MDVSRFRRTISFVATAALITALTVGAFGAPVAATPDEQKAQARAEAKVARDAAKQARAQARAEAKAARKAAKQARAEARAKAKAARKAAKQDGSEKVTVCHKPGTPAGGTLEIPMSAVQAHLDHGDVELDQGDVEEACGSTEPATLTTCQEPGTSDAETSQEGTVDDESVACGEPQQVLVSIDAPESISSQDLLQLQGAVSGLEADDLSYVWSSTCLTDVDLTDPAFIASEPDTAVLVFRGDTLPPRTTCDFTLTVTDEAVGTGGSATVAVEVVALP